MAADSGDGNSLTVSRQLPRLGEEVLNVLHVDDDKNQLDMLRIFLSTLDASINICSCSDPIQALKLVADKNFDCIVSDYLMPRMNGVELAERVKSLKDVPFILYTGHGSEDVAQQAFKAGADDYIRKEIRTSHYEVLLNRIRNAVDRYRAEQIYKVVFEHNPEAVIVTIDNLINFANASSLRLFEVNDRRELYGRPFTSFLLEEESDEISWMTLNRSVSESLLFPFELTLKTAKGSKKLIEGTIQNMFFFGKPAQIYFLKDITERKEMERGLMRAQYLFDRILHHSLIGIAIIDQDMRIERCNSNFRDMLGLDPGCRDFKLLSEPRIFARINGILLPGDSARIEMSLDFPHLRKRGVLHSSRDDEAEFKMIISPFSSDEGKKYLVQILEVDPKQE